MEGSGASIRAVETLNAIRDSNINPVVSMPRVHTDLGLQRAQQMVTTARPDEEFAAPIIDYGECLQVR